MRTALPTLIASMAALLHLSSSTGVAAGAAPVELPEMTRTRLANGLTVFVVPRKVPEVELRLVIRAGAVNDPAGQEGLASLTASLLSRGAGARSAERLAGDIASAGASMATRADLEQITVTCSVPRPQLESGLDLLRDLVVSPTFAPEEFERARAAALDSIAARQRVPEVVADLALGPFLFGDGPLAHPVMGHEESVRRLARDSVVAFHARHMRPDNALLAVVGDVDPRKLVGVLGRTFAGWSGSAARRLEAKSAASQAGGRALLIVDMPEASRTQIRLACVGVARNHPDRYPIQVANAILGAAFTARRAREARAGGPPASSSSRFTTWRHTGAFDIQSFTGHETIRPTVDTVLADVRRLRDQGPTAEELARARQAVAAQFALGLQTPAELSARILDVEFYGLEPDYLRGFPARIEAVTMEDVRRALKSYFCDDDLRILLVSDAEVARPQLEGLGPIEVRDAE